MGNYQSLENPWMDHGQTGQGDPSSEVEAIRAGAVKNYSDSISNDEVRIITRVTTKGKGQTVRK
jgi:hypothetical protein